MMAAAGVVNTGLTFLLGAQGVSLIMGVAGAVLGFFGIGVSLFFLMLGLRHLGVAQTGAYFSLAPFIGTVISVFMLGDRRPAPGISLKHLEGSRERASASVNPGWIGATQSSVLADTLSF